ncbi:IPT/TIG domain-containing protein [Hymenobacter edaphi]|uniref:IPT/TIG domain-containing protein n=1 Tax=Hymenobacter edaphi TaxID=2211146 RepID=A0A328BS00_9BACT|nr:IPT/TIG domain-containing protein [Hymenobacter edaphi]RAK69867.1 hypothetical protein DLM85_03150 [Hymenobacter edaphi]
MAFTAASTTSVVEDMEAGVRTGYTPAGLVTLTNGTWLFTDALIGTNTAQDKFNGTRAARVRDGSIAMNFDKPDGAGTISLKAALFNLDTGGALKVEVSDNGGASYTNVTSTISPAVGLTSALQTFTFSANMAGNVRVRISNINQVAGQRINIDDISISDYAAPSTTPALNLSPAALSTFSTTTGTPSVPQTLNVSGSNLAAALSVAAPAGYEVSLSSGSGYASSVNLTPGGGTVNTTPVYVRLLGTTAGAFTGNVTASSPGATSRSAAVSGNVTAPAPTLSSLSPGSATAGAGAFILTLTGSNFTSSASVSFNGSSPPTTYLSDSQLTAAVPASAVATAGTFPVTVTTTGGTTSASGFVVHAAAAAPSWETLVPFDSDVSATATDAAGNVYIAGSFAASSTFGNIVKSIFPGYFRYSASATAQPGPVRKPGCRA